MSFSECWCRSSKRDGTRTPVLNRANFSCNELDADAEGGEDDDDRSSLTLSTSSNVEETMGSISTADAVYEDSLDDYVFLEVVSTSSNADEWEVASTITADGDENPQGSRAYDNLLSDDIEFLPNLKEMVDMFSSLRKFTMLKEFLEMREHSWNSITRHTRSIDWIKQQVLDIDNILSPVKDTKSEKQGRKGLHANNRGGQLQPLGFCILEGDQNLFLLL